MDDLGVKFVVREGCKCVFFVVLFLRSVIIFGHCDKNGRGVLGKIIDF